MENIFNIANFLTNKGLRLGLWISNFLNLFFKNPTTIYFCTLLVILPLFFPIGIIKIILTNVQMPATISAQFIFGFLFLILNFVIILIYNIVDLLASHQIESNELKFDPKLIFKTLNAATTNVLENIKNISITSFFSFLLALLYLLPIFAFLTMAGWDWKIDSVNNHLFYTFIVFQSFSILFFFTIITPIKIKNSNKDIVSNFIDAIKQSFSFPFSYFLISLLLSFWLFIAFLNNFIALLLAPFIFIFLVTAIKN